METFELEIESRTEFGSGPSSRKRRDGILPGVIYSKGGAAIPIQVNTHDFVMTVRGKQNAQIFNCKSEDASLNGTKVLVKELQKEPLKDRLIHVDLQAVTEGELMTVPVPIRLTGESQAVREGRAIINQTAYEVELSCLPKAIPNEIIVDISALKDGEVLHASQIQLPEGSLLKSKGELVIVNVLATRGGKAAGGEEEEGDAGEGETPA